VVRGRDSIEASFANGLARLVQSAEIETVFAAASGGRVAAHWRMVARTPDQREVRAEGIDVVSVNDAGLITRVEGYWDAAGFASATRDT
jgi:ketosteroid isomerase-like protein